MPLPTIIAAALAAPTMRLVWADEFSTPGRPDPSNWVYESGFVRNKELQWYQPDNARVLPDRKWNPSLIAGVGSL